MSITGRLEEAIINARIAAQLTGVTQQPVGISQDDAVRILAALRLHRWLFSLDESEDRCAECDTSWPCNTALKLQADPPSPPQPSDRFKGWRELVEGTKAEDSAGEEQQ